MDEQDQDGTIHVVVIGYDGESSALSIPTNPENPDNANARYKVTEIGVGAFQNNKAITKVTLPNSVTAIRARAFQGCSNLSEMDTSDN